MDRIFDCKCYFAHFGLCDIQARVQSCGGAGAGCVGWWSSWSFRYRMYIFWICTGMRCIIIYKFSSQPRCIWLTVDARCYIQMTCWTLDNLSILHIRNRYHRHLANQYWRWWTRVKMSVIKLRWNEEMRTTGEGQALVYHIEMLHHFNINKTHTHTFHIHKNNTERERKKDRAAQIFLRSWQNA